MSKRSTSQIDALASHLRELYGDAAGSQVLNGINELIRQYRDESHVRTVSDRLDEKDVLLITYGDTLVDGETPPLRVLHQFYCDYLEDVFGLIHILPFHPYSSDDGFSVIDYYAVREDLGSWKDIENLASDCRVMADAVINHMSSASTWFRRFLEDDPAFAEFFFECDPNEDLSTVVRPRTSPLLTRYVDEKKEDRFIWTTFSADQVDLDYRNPEVLLAVIDVLFFLISKGASLLRLDAVTFLWKQPGTSSANLKETHLLIKVMRSAVSMLRDDVVIITETNVPHRENIAYFGDGHDEAQMVYNFALPPLLAYSFINGDSRQLTEWTGNLSLPSDEVCFLNFSSSHDGVGVRPVEEILDDAQLKSLVDASVSARGLVSSRTLSDGKEQPYELNCTYLDLISRPGDDLDTVVSRFIASQAVVLAMPGVPAIYIQSLLGTRNDLERVNETGRARSINRSRHDYSAVRTKLADPACIEGRVFRDLTSLIRLRCEQPAFDPYSPFEVLDMGSSVFALLRGGRPAGATILCITNLTDNDVAVEIPHAAAGRDLVSSKTVLPGKHVLQPFAICWLLAQKQQD